MQKVRLRLIKFRIKLSDEAEIAQTGPQLIHRWFDSLVM
jgi:hypothetical protein